MNNNSYVYIPANKLIDLMNYYCPPCHDLLCKGRWAHGISEDCVKCWKSWLKDGE